MAEWTGGLVTTPDHPIRLQKQLPRRSMIAPLAQLDRASVYGTEGYWFEPSGVYLTFMPGVASAAGMHKLAVDVVGRRGDRLSDLSQ